MTDAVGGDHIDIAPRAIKLASTIFAVHAVKHATDFKTDGGESGEAYIFSVDAPADPMLATHNRLCSSAGDPATPIHWFVAWETDGGVVVDAFSGADMPSGDIAGSFCGGHLTYEKAKS